MALTSLTEKHLATLEERRETLSGLLEEIFPRPLSFVWEIGCGHGHFLTAYAQRFAEKFHIGIDITGDRIERANRKVARACLPNVRFVQAEARFFLAHLPANAVIEKVVILFPDPWPKNRHHKHRILQPDFLSAVAMRAGQGARIYFRTDYQPYFDSARQIFEAHSDWVLTDEPWAFEHETVFQRRARTFTSLVAKRSARTP